MDALTAPPVSPERDVAADLVRRGLFVAPALVVLAGFARDGDAAASTAIALGIVLVNFGLAALSVGWAARRSAEVVYAVVLGGFLVRLASIGVALWLLGRLDWIDRPVLGVTLVATHLGLLAWEARHVSLTLAAPGLRPDPAFANVGEE